MKIVSPIFPVKCDAIHWKPSWTYQRVYKTVVGANKNIKMKWVQQFSNELNDPHGPPHCL